MDAAVDDFSKRGHSQLEKIESRQKQIHHLWDHLNWLKSQKEKNLEGASRFVHHFLNFTNRFFLYQFDETINET